MSGEWKEGQMVKLGEVYKDKVSGFEGTATCRTEYLNGCI